MRARIGTGALFAVVLLFAPGPHRLLAQAAGENAARVADPDPARFAQAFEQFAAWDAKNSHPENAVLFVGSSSIVRWNTARAFPGLPVINRGFGGSQASDALHWVEEAVLKYDPAVVVYYEGDNDVAAGKKAHQIFEDMRAFAQAVLARDPSTHIVFISVKPSLLRWSAWPEMQATNDLLRQFTLERPNLHFVDVATPMLGADGRPMPNLFVQDGLHMTEDGYAIWNRVVGPLLARLIH
jgi:lysophospholipase L1-like esterase